MFNSLCKAALGIRCRIAAPRAGKSYSFRHPSEFLSSRLCSAASNSPSLTVPYLISSLGFSEESALSVSKYVRLVDPGKPDLVIGVLKDLGFVQSQISWIVRKHQKVLLCAPEKSILPKIEFLRARGASGSDVVGIIARYPRILCRSLEKHIIPSFNVINGILQSDSKAISAIKRWPKLLYCNIESRFLRNVETLRKVGVPDSYTGYMILYQPRSFFTSCQKFEEAVERVRGMGFDPSKIKFVVALCVQNGLAKSTWDRKISIYKRWGWSEEDALSAFRRFPWCMLLSEEKLTAAMEFYVGKMGLESSYLVVYPILMSLSLEKRIVPRCAVVEALKSKNLIGEVSLNAILLMPEQLFLKKFVNCYIKEDPRLKVLYQEKLGILK